MNEQPKDRGRRNDDPERAFVGALRLAVFPTMCVPIASASLGASATGEGLPFSLASPLAAVALMVSAACWLNVIALWRAPPRPGDDDEGWRRWWGGATPPYPGGGTGGINFDWTKFERDFWSHVREQERQREPEFAHARAPSCLGAMAICGVQRGVLASGPAASVRSNR
jgi:hypothetical protein